MTLTEFTKLRATYESNAMIGLALSSKAMYRRCMDTYQKFLFMGSHGMPVDIESNDLYAAFMADVFLKGTREGPRRIIYGVIRFLHWCKRQGIIQHDPVDFVQKPKTIQSPTRAPITRKDYEAIMAVCDDNSLRWLFLTAWHTGMSMVDICYLSMDEVDIDNCCIIKRRRKTEARCIIPIETGTLFHVELLERIKDIDTRRIENPEEPDKFYIMPQLRDWYEDRRGAIVSIAKLVMLKAGVDKRKSFHCFRVAYCSMLANGNINMGLACKMTGHKNPETFVRRYLKVKPESLHKALHEARIKQTEQDNTVFLD